MGPPDALCAAETVPLRTCVPRLADISALSAVEARRFNALKDSARHYLEIFPAELEKARANWLKGRKWRESCRSFGPNKGLD